MKPLGKHYFLGANHNVIVPCTLLAVVTICGYFHLEFLAVQLPFEASDYLSATNLSDRLMEVNEKLIVNCSVFKDS